MSNSYLPVSLILTGILAVRNGERVSYPKPGTNQVVYYQQYLMAILCYNGQRLPAQMRIYSPPGDQTLPDGMVILAFAKANFPKGQDTFLEVIRYSVFPGDPTSDAYEVFHSLLCLNIAKILRITCPT
jgi:hypothetical protein